MIDNTKLFTDKSADYSQYRPSYPESAVKWLRSKIAGNTVLDVGAGTGIFTQVLLPCFANVSAVEPNDDMRQMFEKMLPGIRCRNATGEHTQMPEFSVDLITVAQAFHWLDADSFKLEAMRILRPTGKVAIIWNSSLKSAFTDARNFICQKYCPRFRSGHAGRHTAEEGDLFLRQRFFREVEVVSFPNPFSMDLQTFEGNIRSRSYALTPDDRQYDLFCRELRSVFEHYAENGIVTELQETQIYLGSF